MGTTTFKKESKILENIRNRYSQFIRQLGIELYKYLQLLKNNQTLLSAEHCLMCSDRCEDDYNLFKKKNPQHQKSFCRIQI